MAEKGLVAKDALIAIADAIRAKTETSATMLPGEMADLIAGIKTGDVRYGTFTGGGEGINTFNIGKNIPEGDFALYVMPIQTAPSVNHTITQAWHTMIDGVSNGWISYNLSGNRQSAYSAIAFDRSTGDVSVTTTSGITNLYFHGSYTYTWIYAGGGAV